MKKASNAALVLLGICVLSICLTEPAFAASRANVLDTTVSKFQVAATNFGSRVKEVGIQLLFLLAAIQLSLTFIQKILGRLELDEIPGIIGMFILNIGIFVAVNRFSETWLPAIINSFAKIGQLGSGLEELTPSVIITQGIQLQDLMVQSFNQASGNNGVSVKPAA